VERPRRASRITRAKLYLDAPRGVASIQVDLEIAEGTSLDQLAVGVGTMITDGCPTGEAKWDYNWTESRLRDFVGSIEQRGVQSLDFWRADIDDEGNCTESYYFDVATEFLQGNR